MKNSHDVLSQEFERVRKKQKTTYTRTKEQIDKLLQDINKCLVFLDAKPSEGAGEDTLKPLLGMLNDNIKKSDSRKKVSAEHNSYHKTLSAFSKTIDKHLPTDLSKAYRNTLEFDPALVNQAIAHHLYRVGKVHSAETFEKEAAVEVSVEERLLFERMHTIIAALRKKDTQPALEWAKEQHDSLLRHDSSFEFNLHKMKYIDLLQNGQRDDAIVYARNHLAPFGCTKIKEIQRLMGCLAFLHRQESSPYQDLFDPAHWEELEGEFCHDCFLINTLPQQSYLATTIEVGTRALPKFIKLAEAMRLQGKTAEWESLTTIPVDLELGEKQQFHTLFVCPVTKETGTPSNPPMLLACGHVISQMALQKLPTRAGGRFKCPYCPVEQKASQARQIHF